MKRSPLFVTFREVFVVALVIACPALALPQALHSHASATAPQSTAPFDQTNKPGELIQLVRQSTERFKDPAVADAEGYKLMFGCVSGPDAGAMGMHFVNGALVRGGVIDPTKPQIVIYEPLPNGSLKLIGADYLVLADQWNKNHNGAPEMMGQLFHFFDAPNRFGLPPFYTLHVWAWKENPNGAFVNWHPNVSCQAFAGDPIF